MYLAPRRRFSVYVLTVRPQVVTYHFYGAYSGCMSSLFPTEGGANVIVLHRIADSGYEHVQIRLEIAF